MILRNTLFGTNIFRGKLTAFGMACLAESKSKSAQKIMGWVTGGFVGKT